MISKEEASCIFYCKAFEEENVNICIQNIEASPEVDLSYTNDPNEPSLVCNSRIFGSPNSFKLYKFEQVLAEEVAKNNDKEDIILARFRDNGQNNELEKVVDYRAALHKALTRSTIKQRIDSF